MTVQPSSIGSWQASGQRGISLEFGSLLYV